jgi:hypothetical protein
MYLHIVKKDVRLNDLQHLPQSNSTFLLPFEPEIEFATICGVTNLLLLEDTLTYLISLRRENPGFSSVSSLMP